MKKTLSVILAVITIALCLCSCSKAEPHYGAFESGLNEETGLNVYFRVMPNGIARFGYYGGRTETTKGSAVFDETIGAFVATFPEDNAVLVFESYEDKVVFVEEGSSGVKSFDGVPGLTDGQELLKKQPPKSLTTTQ